jgi:hypothetical protein
MAQENIECDGKESTHKKGPKFKSKIQKQMLSESASTESQGRSP